MSYLWAYLGVGAVFVLIAAARGAFSVAKHEVSILGPDGSRQTRITRDLPEAGVGVALWLLAYPVLLGIGVGLHVRGFLSARRYHRAVAAGETWVPPDPRD